MSLVPAPEGLLWYQSTVRSQACSSSSISGCCAYRLTLSQSLGGKQYLKRMSLEIRSGSGCFPGRTEGGSTLGSLHSGLSGGRDCWEPEAGCRPITPAVAETWSFLCASHLNWLWNGTVSEGKFVLNMVKFWSWHWWILVPGLNMTNMLRSLLSSAGVVWLSALKDIQRKSILICFKFIEMHQLCYF